MSKEKSTNQELEIELLKEQLKNLSSQVSKPKTSEEEFQERVAKYEAKQAERDSLKQEIEKRKMEIWAANPKMRQEEVILMESWERRAKAIEKSNPNFAAQLRNQMKLKVKEVNEDTFR